MMERRFPVGNTYRTTFSVDASTVEDFAQLSGDRNPIHLDSEEAKSYGYARPVAHGALMAAFLSRMIGTDIPGPGAIWMSQSMDWTRPVYVGDEIELVVTVDQVSAGTGVLSLGVVAKNQREETVMHGEAKVKASEKLTGAVADTSGTGRIALVTGGSRGIGAAIARRLGTGGLAVAVNYRESRDAAEGVVDEIKSEGGSANAFAADLGDPIATATMVEEVIRRFGQLDVIVHGATPRIETTGVAELHYGDIEPYIKTYVGGALALVASTSPGMAERGFGRFIFLGTSYMFGVPPVGLGAYLTAKHALEGLARCMATELGPKGITTNVVSPGMTVTDLTADISVRNKELETRKNPMRRLPTVQDTAELVGFLASEGAGFINGANLPVTGGPA